MRKSGGGYFGINSKNKKAFIEKLVAEQKIKVRKHLYDPTIGVDAQFSTDGSMSFGSVEQISNQKTNRHERYHARAYNANESRIGSRYLSNDRKFTCGSAFHEGVTVHVTGDDAYPNETMLARLIMGVVGEPTVVVGDAENPMMIQRCFDRILGENSYMQLIHSMDDNLENAYKHYKGINFPTPSAIAEEENLRLEILEKHTQNTGMIFDSLQKSIEDLSSTVKAQEIAQVVKRLQAIVKKYGYSSLEVEVEKINNKLAKVSLEKFGKSVIKPMKVAKPAKKALKPEPRLPSIVELQKKALASEMRGIMSRNSRNLEDKMRLKMLVHNYEKLSLLEEIASKQPEDFINNEETVVRRNKITGMKVTLTSKPHSVPYTKFHFRPYGLKNGSEVAMEYNLRGELSYFYDVKSSIEAQLRRDPNNRQLANEAKTVENLHGESINRCDLFLREYKKSDMPVAGKSATVLQDSPEETVPVAASVRQNLSVVRQNNQKFPGPLQKLNTNPHFTSCNPPKNVL